MLKFNRLKSLTEDVEVLKAALEKSTSGFLEFGSGGIRRISRDAPENFEEICSKYKDRSLYVKGFNPDTALDEVIEWLEEHGGKTLNVYMRRHPKDKKFKGSVFAVFETKDIAEKLLNTKPPPKFKNAPTTILFREDYWKQKESERDAKNVARNQKQAEQAASREAQLAARMAVGALLELSGLPDNKDSCKNKSNIEDKPNGNHTSNDQNAEKKDVSKGEGEDAEEKDVSKDNDKEVEEKDDAKSNVDDAEKKDVSKSDSEGGEPQGPTILLLKQWLLEKLGTDMPIAWVDVEPAEGKAIVRFKAANSAERAWTKLKEGFGEEPVVYLKSKLSGRVLSGDEEKSRWRTILDAQLQKAQKRRSTGRQGGRGGGGGGFGGNKRRRMN